MAEQKKPASKGSTAPIVPKVVSLTMPNGGIAAALPDVDVKHLSAPLAPPAPSVPRAPPLPSSAGSATVERKYEGKSPVRPVRQMTDNEMKIFADESKLKEKPDPPRLSVGVAGPPSSDDEDDEEKRSIASMERMYPLNGSGGGARRDGSDSDGDRSGDEGGPGASPLRPSFRPQIDEEELQKRAKMISKLERKIKVTKSDLKIPENATTAELIQAYKKLCYETKSTAAVKMMQSVYIHLNIFAESIAKSKPSWGLNLDKWGEYTQTICTSGELDEAFYQIYDEYEALFETSGLMQLASLWLTSILSYSAAQKIIQRMLQEQAYRERVKAHGPPVGPGGPSGPRPSVPSSIQAQAPGDLPPPQIGEGHLRALRREAAQQAEQEAMIREQEENKNNNHRKPAMSSEIRRGGKGGSAGGGVLDLRSGN